MIDRAIELAPAIARCRRRKRLDSAACPIPLDALLDSGLLRGLQPSRWAVPRPIPRVLRGDLRNPRADGSGGRLGFGHCRRPSVAMALFPLEMQNEVWGEDPATIALLVVRADNARNPAGEPSARAISEIASKYSRDLASAPPQRDAGGLAADRNEQGVPVELGRRRSRVASSRQRAIAARVRWRDRSIDS